VFQNAIYKSAAASLTVDRRGCRPLHLPSNIHGAHDIIHADWEDDAPTTVVDKA
jgi:hypothetical protein